MFHNKALKINKGEKGVSLVIAFFIMVIIVAIVLAITTLLYNEIKMIRNIGNSVVAFYAADSGIEKVLYYDRKVHPLVGEGENAVQVSRGLCAMVEYNATSNATACPTKAQVSSVNSALNCNQVPGIDFKTLNDVTQTNGCDPGVCNNCTITFATDFPADASGNGKNYIVSAKVAPNAETGSVDLVIDSLGEYKKLTRKVELFNAATTAQDVLAITGAYAEPLSYPVASCTSGQGINIVIEAKSVNVISNVTAYIKTSWDQDYGNIPPERIVSLMLSNGTVNNGEFSAIWCGPEGSYFVDAVVTDEAGYSVSIENIQPFYFEW